MDQTVLPSNFDVAGNHLPAEWDLAEKHFPGCSITWDMNCPNDVIDRLFAFLGRPLYLHPFKYIPWGDNNHKAPLLLAHTVNNEIRIWDATLSMWIHSSWVPNHFRPEGDIGNTDLLDMSRVFIQYFGITWYDGINDRSDSEFYLYSMIEFDTNHDIIQKKLNEHVPTPSEISGQT